jgi:hypothetical protein
MSSKIQLRRDSAANWTATNPVLAQGEPGLETDTSKVKYGDGSTAWNLLDYASGGASGGAGDFNTGFTDGVNDNTFHFVREQGKKEFTFETEGNKAFNITLTAPMLVDINNGNITFDVNDTPQIADVWLTHERGNTIEFFMKGDYDIGNFSSWYQSLLNTGTGIYVTPAPVPFNVGDQIVCKYWSEGTTYVGDEYDNYSTFIPDVDEPSADNTVTISMAEFTMLGGFSGGTALDALLTPENFSKQSITFIQNRINDNRNITNVVDNHDSTITITFDGAAYQSKTTEVITFSYTATDSRADDWQFTLPISVRPTWATEVTYPLNTATNKYTGGISRSGYATINGGSTIDFYWYGNGDGNSVFWINWKDNPQTYNQGDTIEITFYKISTQIQLNVYRPGTAQYNWNNGYRWYGWKEDITTEYSPGPGNGIIGGTGQYLMKIYRQPIGTWDASSDSLVSSFGWSDLGSYQRRPYDPYTSDSASDWGKSTYNCYPMYSFDRNGIVFFSNSTYNSWSTTFKVRIIYRFDLIIGEDDNWWFNC